MPIFPLPGNEDARGSGPKCKYPFFDSIVAHCYHIFHRYMFRNDDDQLNPCVDRLQKGIKNKGGRNEEDGRISPGFLHSLGNAVENRHSLHGEPSFAGRDAAHDLCPIFEHPVGLGAADTTGDALHEYARRIVNQYAHR